MNNSVYIIIVTYNAMPWIEKCLASCKGYSICIIDNASSDQTVAYICENYPEVQVLPQQKNLGFGQANNIGMRYALNQGADYVFLLNQDGYLQEGCIKKLITVHKEHPDYGVISPIHLNGKGDQLDEKFLLYLNRYKVTNALLLDAFQNNLSSMYPIEFVNAAGWLLSKQTLQTVGGFDPLFFHYGEDRNYCQRVHYHGLKIGVAPSAVLYHDRENRVEKKKQKYSKTYYDEFKRYLKIDWANINEIDFKNKYDARSRYLLSKQRRFFLKFEFKKAKDCQIKRKIMQRLKAPILKSRYVAAENQMPFL